MQKVTWYGVGSGTFEDPILLINSASFTDKDSFMIEILSSKILSELDSAYVKFSSFQPSSVFKLGIVYSNVSPIMPITTNKAAEKTAFNGNNNYGIVDGPYFITVRDSNTYVLRQHIYTKSEILSYEELIDELNYRITDYVNSSPLLTHKHPIDDIIGMNQLLIDLENKARADHIHSIDEVIELREILTGKQEKLIPGVNFATINGQSLLQGNDLQFAKTWEEVTNKPMEFNPTSHTHEFSDVNGLPLKLQDIDNSIDYLESAIPQLSPKGHVHNIGEVTGLQTELNKKRNVSDKLFINEITSLEDALLMKSNEGHGHAISDVSGLDLKLSQKLEQVNINHLLKTASWNNVNRSLVFTREDGVQVSIGIPIDDLFTDVDIENNRLVFSKADGTSVYIEINSILSGVVKTVNGLTPVSGAISISINDIPNLAERLTAVENEVSTNMVTPFQLSTILTGYSRTNHTHTSNAITDFDQAVTNIISVSTPGSHSHPITDITDFQFGPIANDEVLKWNAILGKWVNSPVPKSVGDMVDQDIATLNVNPMSVSAKVLRDNFNTKSEINAKLLDYATNQHVADSIDALGLDDVDFDSYATKTELALKSDKSYVDLELAKKSDIIHSHAIGDVTGLQSALDAKQATLVAGLNIRTINGKSIVGEGNIVIGNDGLSESVNLSLEGTWVLINGHSGYNLIPNTGINITHEYISSDMFMLEVSIEDASPGATKYYPIFTPSSGVPDSKVIITTMNENGINYIYSFYPFINDGTLVLGSPTKLSHSGDIIEEVPFQLYIGRLFKLNNDSSTVVSQMTELDLSGSSTGSRFVNASLLRSFFDTKIEVDNKLLTKSDLDHVHEYSTIMNTPGTVSQAEVVTGTDTTSKLISSKILKDSILEISPAGARPASDVSSWAKELTKPSYNKTEVGLSNVDDTSDLNKPISTATQNALDFKQDLIPTGLNSEYYRGDKTWQPLNKQVVGLSNVDDTSDLNKPISTATQAALNLKSDKTHTHTVSELTDGTDLLNRVGALETGTADVITDLDNYVPKDWSGLTNQTITLADKLIFQRNNTVVTTTVGSMLDAVIDKELFIIVETLPLTDIKTNKIYLLYNGVTDNYLYEEYIYVNGSWEYLGKFEIDLSGYVPTSREVNGKPLTSNITLTPSDIGALPSTHPASNVTNEKILIWDSHQVNVIESISANGVVLPITDKTVDIPIPVVENITGNAVTATSLQTPVNVTVGNTTKQFDGSSNLSFTLEEIGANGFKISVGTTPPVDLEDGDFFYEIYD